MEQEQSRYVRFNGVRVHYTLSIPEDGIRSRVLLLCSPLITAFHWRKLMPELEQQNCLTVTVELPGFGESDCGPQVRQDRETRARILWGILDAVDEELEAPLSTWHLVSHGSACATVLRMAAMYPDSVRSQVFVSPIFRAETPGRDVLELFDEAVYRERNFHELIDYWAAHTLDDYIVASMREPFLRRGAAESFARMLRHLNKAPDEPMGFCPTMAIVGGADPFMTEQTEADIAAMLGEAELHLLRTAGHLPNETHSKALRDYLRGWLKYNE